MCDNSQKTILWLSYVSIPVECSLTRFKRRLNYLNTFKVLLMTILIVNFFLRAVQILSFYRVYVNHYQAEPVFSSYCL